MKPQIGRLVNKLDGKIQYKSVRRKGKKKRMG